MCRRSADRATYCCASTSFILVQSCRYRTRKSSLAVAPTVSNNVANCLLRLRCLQVALLFNSCQPARQRIMPSFPRYNMSNYGRRAFCFVGPYVWNSHSEHIRQSTSTAVFKRSLKTFLLQQISHLAH